MEIIPQNEGKDKWYAWLTGSVRSNGLAFSGRLECTTSIDRKGVLVLLTVKIAPIQPLRCNAVLGRWLDKYCPSESDKELICTT